MLTFALLLSAGMGIIQETLYKKHGKLTLKLNFLDFILF